MEKGGREKNKSKSGAREGWLYFRRSIRRKREGGEEEY